MCGTERLDLVSDVTELWRRPLPARLLAAQERRDLQVVGVVRARSLDRDRLADAAIRTRPGRHELGVLAGRHVVAVGRLLALPLELLEEVALARRPIDAEPFSVAWLDS